MNRRDKRSSMSIIQAYFQFSRQYKVRLGHKKHHILAVSRKYKSVL